MLRLRLTFFSFLLLLYGFAEGQKITPAAEAVQLTRMLEEKHVQPVIVDDAFAERVWSNLLDETDPDRLFFLSREIEELEGLVSGIDNDLKNGTWKFFPAFLETYKSALERARKLVIAHCTKPLSLNANEKYTIDTTWALGEIELANRWQFLLKTEILSDLARTLNAFQGDDKAFFASKESISRGKIQRGKIRGINRISDNPLGADVYVKTLFFKSISASFDPHSEYMALEQMQNFMAMLSTEGFFFGFGLHENEHGELIVFNIVPGEPAWKSGIMEVGDVIEKIRWEGNEWIDLAGITRDELDLVFAESNSARMEFSIRKPGGAIKSVWLKKEKHSNEQSLVRGFLLDGARTIGYIALPSFYSSFNSENGSRCAIDVAKEIIKLKNHSIDGLILDLRNNGGGSLREGVDMAGIFVDAGPIGIEKEKGKDPRTIKDANRGTIFDGPLVIMVNALSASASEFLAAALKDYNRAIIVGSQTFGKGIAQEMFSLQPGFPAPNYDNLKQNPGWGFTTITTAKIYRINGKTIQKYGLTPDVILPDLYNNYEYGEVGMPYALESDSINKKTYYQAFPPFPLKTLQEKSMARVENHQAFKTLRDYLTYSENQDNMFEVSVDWNTVKKQTDADQKIFSSLSKSLDEPTKVFSVSMHEYAKEHVDQNLYTDLVNESWIKNLSRDIALEETFNIVCDYIDISTAKTK